MTDATDDLVGRRVGRVRVVAPLGRGGMGDVYRGWDETLERPVALKRLRADREQNPLARARFLREARLLSRLDHPNVCRIWDLVESDDGDFLVLELVEGGPLDEVLEDGCLDPGRRWELAIGIAEAVAAAHERGIVHRDLKPSNVMVTPAGEAKVLDFGIARPGSETTMDPSGFTRPGPRSDETSEAGRPDLRAHETTRTAQGTVLGSVRWMSPEQARGEVVGPGSDVYSLGLVLSALLLEAPIHPDGLDARELLQRASDARIEWGARRDHRLRSLLDPLLAPSPDDRPGASEVVEALRQAHARPRRRRNLALGIAAAVLLAGAAVSATLRWNRSPSGTETPSARFRVAVLPFVGDGAWSEVLATRLARHPELDVLPADRVERTRERFDSGEETAPRLLDATGAHVVVAVRSDTTASGRTDLTARIVRKDGEDGVRATASHPVEAVDLLADGIVRRLGLSELAAPSTPELDPFVRETLALGHHRLETGDHSAAARYFEVALDRAPDLGTARLGLAEARFREGSTAEAERLLGLVVDQARASGNRDLEARALVRQFRLLLETGRTGQAEEVAERSLDLLGLTRAHHDRTTALVQLGVLAYRRGDLESAERRWMEARTLARALRSREDEADVLRNLGYVRLRRDELDEARALFDRSLELFRTLGMARGELTVLGSLGLLANQTGDFDAAEDYLRRSLRIAEDIGDARMEMNAHVNLGAIAFARGDIARAEGSSRTALELARAIGDPRQQVQALASLGYYAVRGDRLDDAAAHLQEAQSLGEATDVTDSQWLLDRNLGLLHCYRGRIEDGERLVERARQDRANKFTLLAAARCALLAGRTTEARDLALEAREAVDTAGGWSAVDAAFLDDLEARAGAAAS